MKTTGNILIATDGGAIPFKGSLGFFLADAEGTILLTCYGQPAGHAPLSFRLEICAFLAAVRLITKLIQDYYDILSFMHRESTREISVYTDSLSMLKKLEAYSEYPTWDVLSALHRALEWFPTYPKISWVKSHQDDKVYDKIERQMN